MSKGPSAQVTPSSKSESWSPQQQADLFSLSSINIILRCKNSHRLRHFVSQVCFSPPKKIGKINHAEMHLSAIRKFAQDQIHHTAAIRDGDVSIPQYTVMPNHIHMMVVIHRRRDALNASLEPNAERTNNGRTNNGHTQNGRTNNERTNNGRTNNGRTNNGRTRCVPTTISPQWQRFGPQSGNLPSVIRGIGGNQWENDRFHI